MARQFRLGFGVEGKACSFNLCRETKRLPGACDIEYFWMDRSSLRSRQGDSNMRMCIDLWWHQTCGRRLGYDRESMEWLVLAELYPIINANRGQQKLFSDACVGRTGKLINELPHSEWQRLRSMTLQRDVEAIRNELNEIFVGELLEEKLRPNFQKAYEIWMAKAFEALSRSGRPGLHDFLKTDVADFMNKYIKRGNNDRPRLFANMIAYEAKVAFYTMYANAWSFITPELQQQFQLNNSSLRFLSLAHGQSDSVNEVNIFWGQVLALHPVITIILRSDVHLQTLGKWLASAEAAGDTIDCISPDNAEYWDLVATIMAAARQYMWARSQKNGSRIKSAVQKLNAKQPTMNSEPQSDSTEIACAAYLKEHLVTCASCRSPVRYVGHSLNASAKFIRIAYACTNCDQVDEKEIESDEAA